MTDVANNNPHFDVLPLPNKTCMSLLSFDTKLHSSTTNDIHHISFIHPIQNSKIPNKKSVTGMHNIVEFKRKKEKYVYAEKIS